MLAPGARYSVQAPLLWFAAAVARGHGTGVLGLLDEPPAHVDPFEWARECVRAALDLEPAAKQLVIGKSLASAATGLVAERGLPAVWLTPLLDRDFVVEGLLRVTAPTLLIGGGADPTWRPAVLEARPSQVELLELPDADHGLELPGDPVASIDGLARVVAAVERFVAAAL